MDQGTNQLSESENGTTSTVGAKLFLRIVTGAALTDPATADK